MSAVNYLLQLVKQNSCLLRSLKDETVIDGLAEVIRPHCSGVSTIEFSCLIDLSFRITPSSDVIGRFGKRAHLHLYNKDF